MRVANALVICGIVALSACGGGAAGGPGAAAASDKEAATGQTAEADSPSASPASAESRCEDGSCFVCGDGLCPKGFYCDKQAAGGAACSWLPECAAEPSCACLSQALGSDCNCSDQAGVFCE